MNKTSWIIGGSSGIGAALALELSKNGESVCISSRSLDSLKQKAIEISNQTGKYIHHVNTDVSSYEQVSQAAKDIIAKYEKIDRVIFMAGIYEPMKTDCMDPSFTAKIVEVNFLSSRVLLLNDLNSRIPVTLGDDSTQAILSGKGERDRKSTRLNSSH